MGVLMIGVDMPKNCEECNFKGECRDYWEKIREAYTRPSWCPLVEVADRKTEPRGCDADCNEDCTECAKETELWKAEQTEPCDECIYVKGSQWCDNCDRTPKGIDTLPNSRKAEPYTPSVCDFCSLKNRGIPCGTEPRVCSKAIELAKQMEREGE